MPQQHSLFDPSEDDRDIYWLTIQRYSGKGPLNAAGSWTTYPVEYAWDMLPSLEALHAQFGGGTLKVIAKNEARSQIVASKVHVLPGAPIGFGEVMEGQALPVAAARPAGAPGTLDPMAILLAMMERSDKAAAAAIERERIALEREKLASDREAREREQAARERADQQMRMFELIMKAQQHPPPQQPVDALLSVFREGLTIGRNITPQAAPAAPVAAPEADDGGIIDAIIGGFAQHAMASVTAPAPPPAPPPMPPPGVPS